MLNFISLGLNIGCLIAIESKRECLGDEWYLQVFIIFLWIGILIFFIFTVLICFSECIIKKVSSN